MAQTVYKAEVFSEVDSKNPLFVWFIDEENIVEAAIEATKRLNTQKSEKVLRIKKLEEINGEMI